MCMLAAMAQASMSICADSPEYSLHDNAICTKSARAGLFCGSRVIKEQPPI